MVLFDQTTSDKIILLMEQVNGYADVAWRVKLDGN